MSKKLTLSIDNELIDFAHLYSQKSRISISRLFEQYLISLKNTDDRCMSRHKLNPKTAALYGIFEKQPIPDKIILTI
ncbi:MULTISPECIES: DUF6364 family protein [unclassified Treponema]|uniref:DUF6364 family protein n=1 Tax=unclassified Treponema TaxID=2638727 RepID=UPI0020A2B03E|nr:MULTISPECIES: DUF6364 family protein [unclassified Treponema]UTC66318.1 hypothetical protein E4O06_10080 [Treponema sp. OMZ 789]UTC69048.1 hypothetical protein E4O01_10230 [Treponema sp. OMZ 790]UTC71760.1 hypothetical protein E4O02_10320 [Treponema sp. OMZ 791]